MSPNFIADQIQKHIWTIASMLNSNYGAFCCTPLAFRRLWIAARLNALWKQRRGMGECRATRGGKVRKKEWKRNEMHIKKGHNQGVWTEKKERDGKKKGIQWWESWVIFARKGREIGLKVEGGDWPGRYPASSTTLLHLPANIYTSPGSPSRGRLPHQQHAQTHHEPPVSSSSAWASLPQPTAQVTAPLPRHPPAPRLPILPSAILLCWQKTTSFPWAINPWADALHSGS